MGILDIFKTTILRCDLLACSATLRVRGQPVYQSVLGGVLSVIIMSFFIVIFSTSFMSVLNKVDISATMSTNDNTDSSNQINNLMFAIGINNMQLGVSNRHFDIFMEQVFITGNTGGAPVTNRNQILLKPCNISNWSDYGDTVKAQFTVFQMDRMLCPTTMTNVVMKGYEGSPDYAYISLKIKTCTNNSYEAYPCFPTPAINTYITNFLSTNDFFKVKLMVLDTRISPAQGDPISKILEKRIFLSFTNTLGSTGYISFAHYSVTTDTSILPYENQQELTGNYIHKYQTSTIGINSGRYVSLQFFKATEQLTIQRSVSKIDEMLSYVGGLFGLLWVGVAFVLGSFNQYRYQLYAAQAAFTYDQSGRKIKQKDFGLLSYIGYSIYDWLNTFGCAPTCWTKMRQIDDVREQINSQMDITYLLRKIRSLQKTTACLLDHNKRICSMLTREPTLQETQTQRKLLEFYNKLVPSQCQDHQKRHAKNNQISNLDQLSNKDEKSGQQFMMKQNTFPVQQNLSQIQQMSCVTEYNQEQDQDYQELMKIVRDAYSYTQAQRDQVSRRITQKIPDKIKRAITKSRRSRKIIVEQISQKKKFESCQNSFIDAKYK